MGYQLGARLAFAAATFLWALAGSGLAGAGWGALGAILLCAPLARNIGTALRSPAIWAAGGAFALTNASLALATDLMPLATFAAMSQLSPLLVLGIAPLWGERAQRKDWLIALLGFLGVVLVVGTSWSSVPLAGFIATGAFVSTVAVSSHLWGKAARISSSDPASATLVLFIPALPLLLLDIGTEAPLYLLGGALFALGNALMYMAYQLGWSVVRSILLKPLVTLLLAGLGILFLGNQVTLGLLAGGLLILLAVSLVRPPNKNQDTL